MNHLTALTNIRILNLYYTYILYSLRFFDYKANYVIKYEIKTKLKKNVSFEWNIFSEIFSIFSPSLSLSFFLFFCTMYTVLLGLFSKFN